MPSQFIMLDGCFNFRELGGYPTQDGRRVRGGLLYRSDGLHRLTVAGRAALGRLGIVTVIDLRTPAETAQHPWVPPDSWSGQWHHIPVREVTPDFSACSGPEAEELDFAVEHYLETFHAGAAALGRAVRTIATPAALPAAFYCAAGKDRTGILAAIVLHLLGVAPAVIAEDYALSDVATDRWERWVRQGNADDTATAWSFVPRSLLVSDGEIMLRFLAAVERAHGTREALATHLGLDTPSLDTLRSALLEQRHP